MPPKDVTPSELLQTLLAAERPLLLLVGAPDDPLQAVARQTMEQAHEQVGSAVPMFVLDGEKYRGTAAEYRVERMPTFVILHDMKPIHSFAGPSSTVEIIDALANLMPRRGRSRGGKRAAGGGKPKKPSRKSPQTDAPDDLRYWGHPVLPRPSEMIAYLNRFVRGQSRTKRDVASAVYNHYLAQAFHEAHGGEPGRHHILLLGPTGCGKTFIVRKIAELMGVPIAFTSATGLVEAGYRGRSPDSLIRALLEQAGDDPQLAAKGIIFVDEIDKIRRQDVGGGRDISGEGVQNALLTMLDGRVADNVEGTPHRPLDTSRILFICAGAFVDLPGIVRRRIATGRGQIGFGHRSEEISRAAADESVYEALCQAETADFVEFGMIPEFIGRFAKVTVLHGLGSPELREIVSSATEGSSLERCRALAAIHGIDLTFDDGALDAIADEAAALGTGARGLSRLIGRAIHGVESCWPELADAGVSRVIIDRDVVLSGKQPRRETGPRKRKRVDHELRSTCLSKVPQRADAATFGQQIAHEDLKDANDEEIRWSLERIKSRSLGWDEATGSARVWWRKLEAAHEEDLTALHRLAEQLRLRGATIAEMFAAHVQAETDGWEPILHYLDYLRAKRCHDDFTSNPYPPEHDSFTDDLPF
jgi:ATP-dependent Clp protease ATP-binding subunit ClpX